MLWIFRGIWVNAFYNFHYFTICFCLLAFINFDCINNIIFVLLILSVKKMIIEHMNQFIVIFHYLMSTSLKKKFRFHFFFFAVLVKWNLRQTSTAFNDFSAFVLESFFLSYEFFLCKWIVCDLRTVIVYCFSFVSFLSNTTSSKTNNMYYETTVFYFYQLLSATKV